jgi:DNA (cytosine-5)-methyltransferase 1
MVHLVRAVHGDDAIAENLIPEFERVVAEARPDWWLSENVPEAPMPNVPGYSAQSEVLNNRWLGEVQNRLRRFCFGSLGAVAKFTTQPDQVLLESSEFENAVTASGGGRRVPVKVGGSGKLKASRRGPSNSRSLADMIRLQGLPENFLEHAPFTKKGKETVVGNGVALPMGRAVARAVKRALAGEERASA